MSIKISKLQPAVWVFGALGALACVFGGYRLALASKNPTTTAKATTQTAKQTATRKVASQHLPASYVDLASTTLWKMNENGFCLPAKTSMGDESPNTMMRIWGICKSETLIRKNIKVIHLNCGQSRSRYDFFYAQNREDCDAVIKGFLNKGELSAKR